MRACSHSIRLGTGLIWHCPDRRAQTRADYGVSMSRADCGVSMSRVAYGVSLSRVAYWTSMSSTQLSGRPKKNLSSASPLGWQ